MRGQRPTIRDVAKKADVSPATVSIILNGSRENAFLPATVRKVRTAAEQLGYAKPVPKRLSQPLEWERPLIAIFLTQLTGSYYTFIAQAVTQKAAAAGYDTVVFETHRNRERERRLIGNIGRMNVTGAIFASSPLNRELAQELGAKIPVVTVRSGNCSMDLDQVVTDDAHVGILAAEHLLALGHRKVAFIDVDRSWQGCGESQRLVGARSAFEACGDAELTVFSMPAPDTLRQGSFHETRAFAEKLAAEAVKDPGITAFLCVTDYMAYGVMDLLASRGLSVPEDYSVMGCDSIFSSSLPGVRLTSIDRHPVETGYNAFQLLNQRICSAEAPDSVRRIVRVEYISELVIRGTTAAPHAADPE